MNRKGQAWLKRRTARKRLRNSLKRVTEWCRQNRHRRIREQVQLLNAKLRGYNNYYGVNGNRASLDEFFYHVRRIHQRWLNQRSQRHSYTWAAYTSARLPGYYSHRTDASDLIHAQIGHAPVQRYAATVEVSALAELPCSTPNPDTSCWLRAV